MILDVVTGSGKSLPEMVVSPEVANLEKVLVFSKILPLISETQQVLISGSLSQILSEIVGGRANLNDLDLSGIHDIDLALNGGDFQTRQRLKESMRQFQGNFPVEIRELLDAYANRSGSKEAGIRTVTVIDGDGEHQVQVMTPAYLLVTLVDQDVGSPTPPEKFRRKVLEIQSMTSFDRASFLSIAEYDIGQRYLMNKDTFEAYKRMAKDREAGPDQKANMLASYDSFSSIVDQALFMNLINRIDSIDELDYDEIRKLTNLEMFIGEFGIENKADFAKMKHESSE